MEFEHTEMLRKNHCALLKINFNALCPNLIKCGLFTADEIEHCMATTKTTLDGHRKIIFAVYDKGPKAFDLFVKCLRQSGHQELANRLLGVETTIVYNKTIPTPVQEPVHTELDYVHIDVKIVDKFMDDFSTILKPYTMRSKKRGAVLIINNITFKHKLERRGAELDQQNLLQLFRQMGGYHIEQLTDVGHDELKKGIENFKNNEVLKLVDVVFVFIMSHGDEIKNEANVECSDGLHVPASWIESQFYRDGCPYMQNKPKIIVYQTCRGNEHDGPTPVMHFDIQDKWTETDGTSNVPVRKHSDILVCHSTVRGYKAHRHTGKGSWYIQTICKVFMQYACQYHVVDLFQLVDKEMSTLQSEVNGSMQTTGFHNSGFRHCYLNPGIYESQGSLCRFNR